MIIFTGATGRLGRDIVERLLARLPVLAAEGSLSTGALDGLTPGVPGRVDRPRIRPGPAKRVSSG